MEFQKGEVVEWVIQDRGHLLLHRTQAATGAKKKR
jgi:hypothetical protein